MVLNLLGHHGIKEIRDRGRENKNSVLDIEAGQPRKEVDGPSTDLESDLTALTKVAAKKPGDVEVGFSPVSRSTPRSSAAATLMPATNRSSARASLFMDLSTRQAAWLRRRSVFSASISPISSGRYFLVRARP